MISAVRRGTVVNRPFTDKTSQLTEDRSLRNHTAYGSVMASAADVTVRPADYEDIKGILEIRVEDELEDGLDMETLEDYFDEAGVHMFVAEYNDTVIGFAMLTNIDERGKGGQGKGGQGGAFRVSKIHREKKIGEKLFWYMINYARNETAIEYIRAATVKPLHKRSGGEEIGKMVYLNFEGDAKTLRTTLQSAPGLDDLPLAAVVPFTPLHKRKMLNPAVGENVLTNGFLFADGDSYSLCKNNLRLFQHLEKVMLVDDNEPIKSISFGSEANCSRGTVLTIDINCKDIELVKSHMIKHMQNACAEVDGNIIFSFLASGFEDEIKAFCEGIEGLEICHDKPGYTGIVSIINLNRD